jgi:uncharacterized protein
MDEKIAALLQASQHKWDALQAHLRGFQSVLVAFSGGVDSAFVLKAAVDALGDRALALTAVSASIAPEEVQEAVAFAEAVKAKHILVNSNELDDSRYAANPTNRCYFCKTELYRLCEAERSARGFEVVLDGFNADDFKDHRPGHQAAREKNIVSPLASAQFAKEEIRAWSKHLGLSTWDKPQLACLASRLPYGTQVTVERLTQVGRAERAIRSLGVKVFRVRHHGEVARLEVAANEMRAFEDSAFRARVDQAVKACGYQFVAVDLEPFRSGRMNDGIQKSKGVSLHVL